MFTWMLTRACVMQVKARSGRKRGRSTGWEPGLLMPHVTMFKNRTLRILRILNVNMVFKLLLRYNCQCRYLEHILLYRFLVSFRTFKYMDIWHVSPHLVILPGTLQMLVIDLSRTHRQFEKCLFTVRPLTDTMVIEKCLKVHHLGTITPTLFLAERI